jgi:hypothetical protein
LLPKKDSKKEGFGYIFNRIWEWVIDWSWYILKRIFFLLLMLIIGYFLVKIFFIVLKNCLKKRRNNQLTSLRAALGMNRNMEETSFIGPINETLPQAPISIQGAQPVIQPTPPYIVNNPVHGLPVIKTINESSSSASSSDGPGKGNEVESLTLERVQLKNLSASIDTLSKIRK